MMFMRTILALYLAAFVLSVPVPDDVDIGVAISGLLPGDDIDADVCSALANTHFSRA